MAEVFLSYKREDQQIAREVAADLEAEGFSVFFDVRIDVGDSWDATIERELNAARAVVVLWSPKSRESKWVRREAREAMERGILCPALIARCKVPLEFSDVQAADLIGRRARDHAHVEWRRLCDGVGKCLGRKARGVAATVVEPASSNATPRATAKLNLAMPKLPRLPHGKRPSVELDASSAPDASPPFSRRALVIGAAAVGGATAIGGGYYGWTQVRAEGVQRAWEEARAAGTRRAVNTFLREHPDAPQAEEARAALETLPLSVREVATLRGHDRVEGVAFSPDGGRVATSGDADNTARLWDSVSFHEVAVLRGHAYGVRSVAFSLDGARIVTASNDGTARIWDAGTAREVLVMGRHVPFPGSLTDANFSPDGALIVTASGNPTATVWNSTTGRETGVLRGHEGSTTSAAFSPDGTLIVTASWDNTARVWDVATMRELVVLRGHEHRPQSIVHSAAFSPDGALIVTGGHDDTARLWNASTGRELFVFSGHQGPVSSVSFFPDGSRILTSSYDNSARLWDVDSGREIAALLGHGKRVISAAVSPNGTRIATASWDDTARIWEIDEQA